MITTKHIFALSLVILFTLLLRDLPYINVIIIGKIWIIYLLILLLFLLSSIRFKFAMVSYLTILLFLAAFVLTLFNLTFFAEAIGILIYFSLWILFVNKVIMFFTEQHPHGP